MEWLRLQAVEGYETMTTWPLGSLCSHSHDTPSTILFPSLLAVCTWFQPKAPELAACYISVRTFLPSLSRSYLWSVKPTLLLMITKSVGSWFCVGVGEKNWEMCPKISDIPNFEFSIPITYGNLLPVVPGTLGTCSGSTSTWYKFQVWYPVYCAWDMTCQVRFARPGIIAGIPGTSIDPTR